MFKSYYHQMKLALLAIFVVIGWTLPGHCDFTSVTVTDLKAPATFYSGRQIEFADFQFTVVSTSPADSFGMEPGWTATVNLVSATGTTPLSNDLSTSTLSDPEGRQVYNPLFRILSSFNVPVRFQVTIASANAVVLGSTQSQNINVFDYESSSMTLIKTEFFTGKNANVVNQGVRTTVISTASANSFGLEPWMAVHVAVVPIAGTGSISNEIIPTTINMSTSAQNATPVIRPQSPHTGSSVRYQLTITSANSTTPLIPRIGINPSFTSAINIYDFESGSATVLRSPADFFTGKNANLNQPGMQLTVISTSPDTAPVAFGLESYMNVYIAVAPNSAATSVSNEVRPAPLALASGSQLYTPAFFPEAPHTGSSVRYQVTVTSSNSTTALVPRTGTNPFFTTSVNIYDYVQSSVTIVQGPDPANAVFTVDQDINPNPYGVNVVIRSTEPNQNFGPEASHMRLQIELIDFSSTVVTGGLSQEDFVPGTDFPLRSAATNYPNFSPRFASYDKTARFRVTVSSANGQLLIPQFGVNPSTSALMTVNAGTPSKFLLLPENVPLVRPDLVGRTNSYGSSAPFSWNPSVLGEGLTVKAYLTDRWSNSVNLPDTELQFAATEYLTLPAYNFGSQWIMDSGIQGTDFVFNLAALEVVRPITVNSPDGFTSDTIYIVKVGLPEDQIFAGPSPFNPKIGDTIKFGFQMDSDITVKILVLDLFGRKVWETSVPATANTMNTTTRWDGRNERGELVAAGVYWVVLEKNGDWISKKKFGVIK